MRRIYKTQRLNPGDRTVVDGEPEVESVQFTVHKFSSRARPADRRRILIICNFSEFGCETVGVQYCIPRLLQKTGGQYVVAAGWYGRAYLYRHLVDEYWEMGEEHQWLRDYAIAFHNTSRNLLRLEGRLGRYGNVMRTQNLGVFCLMHQCLSCGMFWESSEPTACRKCGSEEVLPSLFGDTDYWKEKAVRIPKPSAEKMELAKQWLGPRPVALFARARKTYGRNFPPEYYVRVIELLERMGYTPVWLGEKVCTLPCPVPHVKDFSRSEDSRDLETTLAIISQCRFTLQYWTASTRLAGMMGVPYILFESPDQMWGYGHEGYRRRLCDFGPTKLVVNQYERIRDDQDTGIRLTEQAVREVEQGNYEDIFGLLETERQAQKWRDEGFQISTLGDDDE